MKKYFVILSCFVLTGCATMSIDSSISKHQKVASQIKIGDSKEKALSLLLPTQEGLGPKSKKQPEAYKNTNGDIIEIYYMRTGRQPDNLTTDDEFTPYIFTNNELTAIGWTALGGPKSHGKVIQPAPYINMQQKQDVNVW